MCDGLTPGVAGVVWFIFWLLLSFEKPSLHPRITDEERDYIETSIGETVAAGITQQKVSNYM
jgi:hypothetical protein